MAITAHESTVSEDASVDGSMPMPHDMSSQAINQLHQEIISLQAQKGDSIRLLDKAQVSAIPDNGLHHINSIVWELERPTEDGSFSSSDRPFVLTILSQNDRVDRAKLQEVFDQASNGDSNRFFPANTRLKLAPSDELPSICGFPSGSVPPLGLTPSPQLVLVEEALVKYISSMSNRNMMLIGGGGTPNQSTVLPLQTLLAGMVSNVRTGSFRRTSDVSTITDSASHLNGSSPAPQSSISSRKWKPFFCVEPPDTEEAMAILQGKDSRKANHSEYYTGNANDSSNSDETSNLSPQAFTAIGMISGVRRIARQLVFADFSPPPQYHTKHDDEFHDQNEEDDRPWRNPRTKEDMAVQLVLGKTIMNNLGEEDGEVALRMLKKNQLILVHGLTNVDNLNSLLNWTSKMSLDVRVTDYQVLQPAQDEVAPKKSDVGFQWEQGWTGNKRIPKRSKYVAAKEKVAEPSDPNMELLQLKDLYDENEKPVVIADSTASVEGMHRDISKWLEDNPELNGFVGIDCEWKPTFLAAQGEPQPVLLMQVCVHPIRKIYLLDLQTLLRPFMSKGSPKTDFEDAVSGVLETLFQEKRLIKTGFKVLNDFRRLSASYPHMTEFHEIHSVVELSRTAMRVLQLTKRANIAAKSTSSLAKMSEFFLKKSLDKTEQTSDWSSRPMTLSQIEYAALDAIITPYLLEHLLSLVEGTIDQFPTLGRWENDTAFADAIKSWKMIVLNHSDDSVAIRRLNAQRTVGSSFVLAQSWTTGDEPPKEPNAPDDDKAPFVDVHGMTRIPSPTVSIPHDFLERVMARLIGERVSKSKDGCLSELLANQAILDLPNHRLDFPQRAGYVEFANAVALFVTMPFRPGQLRKYPNDWIYDGTALSWFIHDDEWKNGSSRLATKMLGTNDQTEASIILFVRRGKEPFVCCGRCSAEFRANEDVRFGNVLKVTLHLKEHDKLLSSGDFQNLQYM
ncbi:unnamed protein product [Cylindrotheca closterium]|uniref:3'-5' exonuclease domain-containing protein n=1 Tax=Cylindrotheca closterium TaxID=2856 RepID=A0AAD2GCQ4_9STRA|nr:unnamed protein product [Cylindrotheca closterium]